MNKDESAALAIHNSARARKGVHPLKWDQGLAHAATQYAQHLAQLGKLQHASGTGQGENLFWKSPADDSPYASGAQAWINEARDYHGEKIPQGNFSAYGHYTQCMWKSTTHVGMGKAIDAKGGVYVVGRYSPQGNIVGQTPY